MNHVATLARLSRVYRVFARLVTLDFGCQMSEAGNSVKKETKRFLLAKRRDVPSPVVSSRSGFSPGGHADSRTGLVDVRSKRHGHGPLNSLDDGRSLPRGHHSVTSQTEVTAMLEYYDITESKNNNIIH